jgi:hypothetical protein
MSEEKTDEEETADDREVIDPSDFQTLELTLALLKSLKIYMFVV